MSEIECLGTVSMTDGLIVDQPAEHGWVAYNSGPCEWFWSATRERLEHSLTDDLRPATALEKLLLNKQGNQTHDSDAPPPQDHAGYPIFRVEPHQNDPSLKSRSKVDRSTP